MDRNIVDIMKQEFKMVAKTLKGLEAVLADELRALGANNVEPGRRMVAFEGDLEMLYKANLCCRTALRVLKPFYEFTAGGPDELYDKVKSYDWGSILSLDKTFSIDTVVNSDSFHHSRFVTYRVKDAIVDWFRDRYGADKRPGVRLTDADVMINVHIQGQSVTLSLDSSGESLHKRGWRTAQTEAPINEVLAAGILLISGYDGSQPLVDPMCGSGTFLIEAAMIAANIYPGLYRKHFAFENWPDFDAELFDSLYNDDSHEREVAQPIIGADISPTAIEVVKRNLKSAGVARYVTVECKALSQWEESPAPEGMIVTNPPYGERISVPDMEGLYELIGQKLKHVFTGWQAWIIGYREEYFKKIGLAPSCKVDMLNGALDCELREYVIFAGTKREFRAAGGRLKDLGIISERPDKKARGDRRDKKPGYGNRRGGAKYDPRDFKESRGYEKREDPRGRLTPRPRPEGNNNIDNTSASDENPLARRRNPNALKSLIGRTPSLPKQDGPIMRSRGWKKKD